jgi:hypothetical protein
VKACLGINGNFVLYDINFVPLWMTGWSSTDGSNPYLISDIRADVVILDDANLVVFTGYNTPTWKAQWTTGKVAYCNGNCCQIFNKKNL